MPIWDMGERKLPLVPLTISYSYLHVLILDIIVC